MVFNVVSRTVSITTPESTHRPSTEHVHPTGHLTMISFGGVVGASIWYGVGFAVAYSGPLGALICFGIIGIDVFMVMQCIGEMSTLYPIQGQHYMPLGRSIGC